MSYAYLDNNQFEIIADEFYSARPVCPKCSKPMQFIEAHYTSYGDAAYWECDQNILNCPHDDIVIVWHSDVQGKYIQQLEHRIAELESVFKKAKEVEV